MKKNLYLIYLLTVLPVSLVLLMGCNGERIPNAHFIRLDNGTFRGKSPDKYPITTRQEVSDMFAKIRETEQIVILHFHGGLVSVKQAFENPVKKIVDDEFNKSMFDVYDEKAYPIFFIWESGFIKTLKSISGFKPQFVFFTDEVKEMILEHNRNKPPENIIDEFFQTVLIDETAKPGDLSEDLLDKYNQKYNNWPPEMQDELKKAIKDGLGRETDGLNRIMTVNEGIEALALVVESIADEQQNELVDKYSRMFTSKVFYLVLERIIVGRQHSLTTTIKEERWNSNQVVSDILKRGWKAMKDKNIGNAFGFDDTKYGGTAFLKELGDLIKEKPGIRVILVGHSAGAIYVCELLERAAEYASLAGFKFDVIFEAPACTLEKFHDTITLNDEYGNKIENIRNFRMFALQDHWEKKDKVGLKIIYSSSLLYLVSSIGEQSTHGTPPEDKPEYHDKPLLGMERYLLNEHFNYDEEYYEFEEVKKFMEYESPAKKGKIAFSKAGEEVEPGWRITAETHGECDNDVELLKSLQHIISKWSESN